MYRKSVSKLLFVLLMAKSLTGQVTQPASVAVNLLIPTPTRGYLDTFNTVLKDQQDVFGNNFHHDIPITLSPAIRGLGIHTWYPETRADGKAYKECNCAKLTYYHQFVLDVPYPLDSWSDYDLNFHVRDHRPRFDRFFNIGPPPARIKDNLDLAVKLIKKLKLPTNDGFESVEGITGDPDDTQNMEFEVQPAYPSLVKLKPSNPVDNIFGDYRRFPLFICAYGPWVRDILHPLGYGRPEIHPVEQFWWKSRTSGADYQFGNYNLVLVNDASGRFLFGNMNQLSLPGTFAIGFETSATNPLSYGISSIFTSHVKSDYKDGKQHYLVIGKDTLIRAMELDEGLDDFYDVSFERLTKDANNVYRGYLVLKSVIGVPMKASDFIAQKNISAVVQTAASSLTSPAAIIARLRLKDALHKDGCYDCDVQKLISGDSIRFFGGLHAFVRKTSNQKVTVELTLQTIKRLHVNSFRDSLELRGQKVEIHDPVLPVPPSYNEKSVYLVLSGGRGPRLDYFLPSLAVGEEAAIANKKISWTGYISDNPSWRFNCYKDQSQNNPVFLGSFDATGDPLKNGTARVITQLKYDGYTQAGNAKKRSDDNTTPDNPIPVEINLFQLTYSYRVVPVVKPNTH